MPLQIVKISSLVMILLVLTTCCVQCYPLPKEIVGKGINGKQAAQEERTLFETFSQQALTANDGGSSQNNGTNDNGQWNYYGSQQQGVNSRSEKTYPYSLYFEKTVHVLTNWARMSPVGFKSRFNARFNSGVNLASSGLNPLFEHFNLVEGARYHSYDMSNSNCFSHDSCNGETTQTRINSFYTKKNYGWAENIAAGQTTPLDVTIGWINSDGHRTNMLGAYTLLGVGYFPRVKTADYPHYWTQNFADGTHGISNPIVSASHIILTSGQLTFLANYYHKSDLTNSRQVKSVQLFIEDKGYTMSIPTTNQFDDKPANGMGTFEYTLQANTSAIAGCRKYYIKATDSSNFVYYYPSFGYLLTQDENVNCKQSYLAQQKSSDVVNPTQPIQPVASQNTRNGTVVTNNTISINKKNGNFIITFMVIFIFGILLL